MPSSSRDPTPRGHLRVRLAVAIALALATVGCERVAGGEASTVIIDLSSVVGSADAIADVEVEAVDADGETASVHVESVEWQRPGLPPVPEGRLRMWWHWQQLDGVQPGDRVLAVFTHVPEIEDEKGAAWQASYVLDADTLEPFPAPLGSDPKLITANEELADLYGSAQLSRREKLHRFIGYVDEQT